MLNEYAKACPEELWRVPSEHRQRWLEQAAGRAREADGLVLDGEAGFAYVESAPFESHFFGLRMAKISTWWPTPGHEEALVQKITKAVSNEGWEHLAVRMSGARQRHIRAMEESGFRIVDLHATLFRDCLKRETEDLAGSDERVEFEPVSDTDMSWLDILAPSAFGLSRFYADPELDKQAANRLYKQWLHNNIGGRAAVNLVARLTNKPAGFISCLLHLGNEDIAIPASAAIDLIAVDAESRNTGVGKALVLAALDEFHGKAAYITTGTQAYNYPALRMYMACGFRLQLIEVTLHLAITRNQ